MGPASEIYPHMLKIEKAKENDQQKILEMLRVLDLYHPARIPDDFWVVRLKKKIVGIACMSEYGDFYFLSSVGVLEEQRHRGIAKAMLEKILGNARKGVYLYTIIPDFFRKFDFDITAVPPGLPSKEGLGCENCLSEKCVCMVKRPETNSRLASFRKK